MSLQMSNQVQSQLVLRFAVMEAGLMCFSIILVCIFVGEKLVLLKSRLQQAMAIRRKEERERRAALHRLDNEDCEEEEEAEMTESEDEEVLK